jgi:hypothetical protein
MRGCEYIQALIVRKDRRAEDIVVSVKRIDSIEKWDRKPRLERMSLVLVVHLGPRLENYSRPWDLNCLR